MCLACLSSRVLSFGTSVILPCLLLASAKPQAQTSAPKLAAIHATGQKRYSEAQVVAATGLQTGLVFDSNALNAAADRLARSGAFEEVKFRYHPEGGQMTVEFTVKEASKFHRCTFDNFVWFSAQELEDHLRKEVPLYDVLAPESGDLLDEIVVSLQRLVQNHGIITQVEHTHYGKLGSPDWEHLFIATGPSLKIQSVQFQGAKGMDEAVLHHEALQLVGQNFSIVFCRAYAAAAFVPLYRGRGYLRVQIGNASAQVLKHANGTNEFEIQVTYPVTEGMAYDWERAEWSGNRVFAPADLDEALGMKRGSLADGKKIDLGWEAISKAYGKKGYLEAKLNPEPVYDNINRRVSFRVPITEGPQYRMGSLMLSGMPPTAARELQARWRLKTSDVYDASYLTDFLKEQAFPILAGSSGRMANIHTEVHPDRTRLTVEVSIRVD